ncbi:hypothetical protein M8R20_10970 [Pseudomonas sp. R2.Fl]|nr:hypothetical protein [Pseudomonas sp. R2.Fl]
MLGSVLEKVDSWLGRSFLLARYFPWLLFGASNLLMAALEFSWARDLLAEQYANLGSSEKLIDLAVFLGAVAVLAFTVSPLLQPLTGLLEGRSLWRWLREPLLLGHVVRRDALSREKQARVELRAGLRAIEAGVGELGQARNLGVELGAVTDPEAIDDAERKVRALRHQRLLNRPMAASDMSPALVALKHALIRNCAEVSRLKPEAVAAARKKVALRKPLVAKLWPRNDAVSEATRLARLQDEFVRVLIPYARDDAVIRESKAFRAYDRRYAAAEITPTRFGNDAAALRSYCETRYNIEFDAIWPRLQLVMKDEKLLGKLETARIQVDFSALSLVLSAAFVLIWLLVLGLWGTSLFALLILVAAAPPVVGLWLWVLHESYTAYADTVRGTIDVARFDLVTAMHRPLPDATDKEREMWEKLQRLLLLGTHDPGISFDHPKG